MTEDGRAKGRRDPTLPSDLIGEILRQAALFGGDLRPREIFPIGDDWCLVKR
jgi:hypothetical protein